MSSLWGILPLPVTDILLLPERFEIRYALFFQWTGERLFERSISSIESKGIACNAGLPVQEWLTLYLIYT